MIDLLATAEDQLTQQTKVRLVYGQEGDHLQQGQFLYRAEYQESYIHLIAYPIVKRTPCGVYIASSGWFKHKYLNLNWFKCFAVPSIEEALYSLYRRRCRQIEICTYQIEQAKEAILLINQYNQQGQKPPRTNGSLNCRI